MPPTRLLLLLADYVPDPRLRVDSTRIMLCRQHGKISTKTTENMQKNTHYLLKNDPWEPPGPLWDQCVSQETPRVVFSMIFMHFWSLFKVPGHPFGGHVGTCFVKSVFFPHLFDIVVRPLENERNWSSPRGAGHPIRSCRRMFREGRQWSTWLRFGLHFGSILGAQVATILLFGRPGLQIGCPEACLNFVVILRPQQMQQWSEH